MGPDFATMIDRLLAGDLSSDELQQLLELEQRAMANLAAPAANGNLRPAKPDTKTAAGSPSAQIVAALKRTRSFESLMRSTFRACESCFHDNPALSGFDEAMRRREQILVSGESKKKASSDSGVDLSRVDLLFAGMLPEPDMHELASDAQQHAVLRAELADSASLERLLVDAYENLSRTPCEQTYPSADRVDRYLAGDLTLTEQAEFLAEAEDNGLVRQALTEARRYERLMGDTFRKMANALPSPSSTGRQASLPRCNSTDLVDRYLAGALTMQEREDLLQDADQSQRISRHLMEAQALERLLTKTFAMMADGAPLRLRPSRKLPAAMPAAPALAPAPVPTHPGRRRVPTRALQIRQVNRKRWYQRPSVIFSLVLLVMTFGATAWVLAGVFSQQDVPVPGDGDLAADANVSGSGTGDSGTHAAELGVGNSSANSGSAGAGTSEVNAGNSASARSVSPSANSSSGTPAKNGVDSSGTQESVVENANRSSIDEEWADLRRPDRIRPEPVIDSSPSNLHLPPQSGSSTTGEVAAPAKTDDASGKGTASLSVLEYVLPLEVRDQRNLVIPQALEVLRKQARKDGTFFLTVANAEEEAKILEERKKSTRNSALLNFHVDASVPNAIAYNARCIRALIAAGELADSKAVDRAIAGLAHLAKDVKDIKDGKANLKDTSDLYSALDAAEVMLLYRDVASRVKRVGADLNSLVRDMSKLALATQDAKTGMWGEYSSSLSHWKRRWSGPMGWDDKPGRSGSVWHEDVAISGLVLQGIHAVLSADRTNADRKALREAMKRAARRLIELQSATGPAHSMNRAINGNGIALPFLTSDANLFARGWTYSGLSLDPENEGAKLERDGLSTAHAVHGLVATFTLLTEAEIKEFKKEQIDIEKAIADGMAWLDLNNRYDAMPTAKDDGASIPLGRAQFHFAYLNAVADLMAFTGDLKLGNKAWYTEMNRAVLKLQQAGTWVDDKAMRETLAGDRNSRSVSPRIRHAYALLAIFGRSMADNAGRSLSDG